MRKLYAIILMFLVSLFAIRANAYDFSAACSTGQTLYYNITSDSEPFTVEVTSENTSSPYYSTYPSGDLEIPESVEYDGNVYSVTSIGANAFFRCEQLTSVTIPDIVVSIGESAFGLCIDMQSLELPDSLTIIGSYSFESCYSMTGTLIIPDNVETIGYLAFHYCWGLSGITVPESVTSIGFGAFSGCSGLTTFNFNAINCTTMGSSTTSALDNCLSLRIVNIGENVTRIPDYAFVSCRSFSSITIPSSVTSIGNEAFSSCTSLSTVTIPSSVTSIGTNAFRYVKNIVYDGTAEGSPWGAQTVNGYVEESLVYSDDTRTILTACFTNATSVDIPSSVTEISQYAFLYCTSLTSVFIPNSVTSIGYAAFHSCSGLESVDMSNSVTSIDDFAFHNCTSLTAPIYNANCFAKFPSGYATEYTIPDGIQQIAGYAFYECGGLVSVTIPSSVTSIGKESFSKCTGLAEVTIPSSVTSIGSNAFSGCTGLTTVNFNATNCTSMGTSPYTLVFDGCTSLTTLNIGENVTRIPDRAFYNCTGLSTLTIPNSVINIGDWAFRGCSGLTELTLSDSLTRIGDQAFYECSGLAEITIPELVTYIGGYAFEDCTSLTTVNFNAINCTVMGTTNQIFSGCSLFTTLNIGERVKNIPNYAFRYCSGLTELTIPDSVTNIGILAFEGCNGLSVINYNAVNCTYMGEFNAAVFRNCTNAVTLNIGENVTSIPDYAFYNFHGLTGTVNISNSVTHIGYSAFSDSGIAEVTIPHSVTSIDDYAFYLCSALTTVNFNASHTTMSSTIFMDCDAFTNLTIGENVTTIPGSAFYNCSGLREITIPEGVTSIGNYAFYGCANIETVNFNAINCADLENSGGSSTINQFSVFGYSSALTTLTIGENVTHIPAWTFNNCRGLTGTLNLPNSITSIGAFAFANCDGLTGLVIPDSVISIGEDAFRQCTGLTGTLTIPENVADIGDWAFMGCSGLTDLIFNATNCTTMGSSAAFTGTAISTLTIGENVTNIPDYAFKSCSNLTGTITIPDSVIYIGSYAFNNCNALDSLVIGASVETIGNSAFFGCENIAGINMYESTPPYLGNNVFSSAVYNSATVWTPCPAATNYRSDSRWGQFANIRNEQTTIYNIAVQTADASMGDVSGDGSFTCDTEVELIATPNDGYRFLSWNDGNEDNPRTITVGGDSTFVASFRAVHTITASAGEHGSISPSGDVTVDEASDQSFTITPNTYYRIASVIVDGQTDVTGQLVDGVYTFVNVTEDHTIFATFESIPYTIEVVANNNEYGSVSGGGTYDAGTEISITATPNDGYRFVSWNDANIDNPRTLIVTSDSTFVATFVRNQFTITVLSSDSNGGSVTGEGTYTEGDTATLTATPSIGYCFISWNDGSTDNPRMVEVVQDSTFVAEFSATAHRAIDTTVTSYLSVDEHTFYVSGIYSYVIPSDEACDTIVDLTLQVLDEPEAFDISPNPAKSIISISSENYISLVEIYSTTGKLVIQKQIDANRAEVNVEWLVPGVYFIRLFGEDVGLPSVKRFVKE